jgi:hypothetical protein
MRVLLWSLFSLTSGLSAARLMSIDREVCRACAIVCVHHSHLDKGRSSVWALRSFDDSAGGDAPAIENYRSDPRAALLVEKMSDPLALKLADSAVRLLDALGIRSTLRFVSGL